MKIYKSFIEIEINKNWKIESNINFKKISKFKMDSLK